MLLAHPLTPISSHSDKDSGPHSQSPGVKSTMETHTSRMTHSSSLKPGILPKQEIHSEAQGGYFDIPRKRISSLNRTPGSPHPLSIEYKDSSSTESDSFQPSVIPHPLPATVQPKGSLSKTNTMPKPAVPKDRPGMIRFYSTPTLPCLSPTRQQFRLPNTAPRLIKETLNASLRIDETGKTINQYLIKEEIGRGSFGTVWLVSDTTTNEQFAMKEYSKAALRRHKQSEKLRERRTARRRGPAVRNQVGVPGGDEDSDTTNPLNLIRREIAIMKKLDHPNIVTLVEVLDDPHGDSIYMILEWCGKGAIMPVSLEDGEAGDSEVGPRYTVDQCRLYFRDMILGIEYLHSQGVIHRDIKADNLLLDEDDVVKIADFGVSEILDPANDTITKNAGSPAYMAPELAAISSHTALKEHAAMKGINVSSLSGKSTDIWSMGVTLYLLVFGKLPFRSDSMVDLFDKIVNQELDIPEGTDSNLVDLLSKILAKAPQDRISMDKLREHPWVTHNNEDMLLSKEENTAINITPVTEEDMYHAIEFVQGLMEPDQAMAKLRRLHGWRGYTNSNTLTTNSRAASLSPTVFPVEPGRSPSPIDETVSLYKLTRALEEVVNKANAYTYLHPNRSMSSIDCSSPSMAGSLSSTTEDSSKILDVSCQEPTMQTSTTLEAVSLSRRPSRTHARAVMGLESMTSVRSRSLDPETRL